MRLLPTSLFTAALLCLAAAGPARAEGGAMVPPIDNPVVQKECGACHMAYAPQMLPTRSFWTTALSIGGTVAPPSARAGSAAARQRRAAAKRGLGSSFMGRDLIVRRDR